MTSKQPETLHDEFATLMYKYGRACRALEMIEKNDCPEVYKVANLGWLMMIARDVLTDLRSQDGSDARINSGAPGCSRHTVSSTNDLRIGPGVQPLKTTVSAQSISAWCVKEISGPFLQSINKGD